MSERHKLAYDKDPEKYRKQLQRQAKWVRETYYREMNELLDLMGGECVECGSDKKLEVDHIYGRDWEPKNMNRIQRVRRYRAEWDKGLIRLLCKKCNQFRWPKMKEAEVVEEEVPF